MANAYDSWLKEVIGFDPEIHRQASQSQAVPEAESLAGDILGGLESVGKTVLDGAKKVGEAIVTGAKAAEDGVVAGAKAVGEVVEKGIKAIGDEVVSIASGSYEKSMARLETQIQGVKDAGLDATPYEAQAKSIRDAYAAAFKLPDLGARASAASDCGKRADEAADGAEADIKRLKKSAVEGVSAAITDMRDGAKSLIDGLAKENAAKPGLEQRLATLDKVIEVAGKLTDRAKQAQKLKEVNKAAEKLFDDAAKASTDKSTIQAVYKKALEDRYGFTITNPSNMPNTHLDQVYKMFDRVPDADVVQSKMKTLTYQPLTSKGGKNTGAAYGGATIFMGDYGNENWMYKDPKTGKPAPANGFSISTLHELGHSVDDRFKIMAANQGKPGGGGWRQEYLDSVAKVFVDDFKAGAGKGSSIPDDTLSAAVQTALGGGGASRPEGISDSDWSLLQPLLDVCAKRRNDKWPWGHPHVIGGRAYHEAYPNQWWSYDAGSRGSAPEVRDYQYRAPGEWFAELYAYSFYNETKPGSGVDAAIAAYMYGGKSAADSSPGT